MAVMIALSVLVGANTVLSRFLNAECARRNGLNMSTVCNYITGLTASAVVLMLVGERLTATPQGFGWAREGLMWLGGAVGVIAVELSIYVSARLPAFQSTLLMFIGQLAAGLLLDWLTQGALSLGKIVGGALVVAGLWHYQWVGRKGKGESGRRGALPPTER